MKQTAVEWLVEELFKKIDYLQVDPRIINQAKEMEREQIIDAFVECWKENMPEGYECKQSAEYYYNETFKSE
jgi:HEPN domain-containing protein